MLTPFEIIGRLAPEAIRAIMSPGPSIATSYNDTSDWMDWAVTASEDVGNNTYTFVLESPASLRADCTVTLDHKHRVAVHRTTLKNTSDGRTRPMNEAVAFSLLLEGVQRPAIFSCGGAGSGVGWPHAREFPPDAFRTRWTMPISPRPVYFESGARAAHSLTSSTQDLPIFMIRPAFETDDAGLWIGIEWPTRWHTDISFGGDRTGLRIDVGPGLKQLVLEPGECIELPVIHIGFFEGRFEGGTNACRGYIREQLTPLYMDKPMVPPVVYTLWGLPPDFTQEHVMRQIDLASAMGVEKFCCDQSWYAGSDAAGVGNWEVDMNRFPEGLEPVADYVREKGMEMGLYFESCPHDDTKILREHPEFFFKVDAHGNRHHIFNFGMPDACDYFIDLISSFVELLDLRFIRADFGGYPVAKEWPLTWDMIDPDDKIQFAYVQGKYRVWETLLERHPKLMWELNAGGGNSLDLGSMRRHHCCWGSDMMEMDPARMMQLGAASFMPGNFMGNAIMVGEKGSRHPEAELNDISFLSRMAGSFYVCGCLHAWPDGAHDRARHWIAAYKQFRHLLMKDFYRLLPQPQSDEEWDVAQFCDGPHEGVLFAFRLQAPAERQVIVPRATDPGATYRVRDEATQEEITMSGEAFGRDGLSVALPLRSAKLYTYVRAD
jgi:alpha-galactosidase